MKTRYIIDADSGLLTDRDGNSIGRVVGLTIETSPLGDRGSRSLPSTTATELPDGGVGDQKRPTASSLEADAIARVWEYWFELFPSKRKRKIDSTSKGLIKNAIRLRGEEDTKKALLGLSRSPFHGGRNEQQRKYQELRHALKGKQRDGESDDERIERAIEWGVINDPGYTDVDPDKVERWRDEVCYAKQFHSELERGRQAYRNLVGAGFKVEALDKPPYARVSR